MKLTNTQFECLKEINGYRDYPPYWKPKTREKLEQLGLVHNRNSGTNRLASYQLTEEGKKYLISIEAA